MGAKVCMLIYLDDPTAYALAQSPTLNGPATDTLVNKLFPHTHLSQVGMGNLAASNPTKGAIYAACFGGLSIVAAEEFGGDHPSKLTQHFLTPGNEQQVVLLAMHSVVDWFAYAYWQRGRLVRALSLAPD